MSTLTKDKPPILRKMERASETETPARAIGASAGTGKTYTLERLVLDRILADDATGIEDILVVTFTRRATAEMKGRVRGMLESVLADWEDGGRDGESTSGETDGQWVIDDAGVERVREALDSFDEASISTIHAFCQQVLKDHAFTSRRLFDAELVDASELFTDCFYDVLRDTLAAREPERTWVRRALEAYSDLDDLADHLRTIHSRGAEVVPTLDELELSEQPPEDAELDKWKVMTACWHRFGEEIAARMEERKRQEGLMTYDDLLEGVRDRLADGDGGLGELLADRFDVVMVDEFQDTDPVQWEIFRRAFLDVGREVVLIGDAKQSIYRFRGADVETYRGVIEEVPEEANFSLETNYRSSDELIDTYNRLFEAGFFEGDYQPVHPPEGAAKVRRDLCGAIGDEPIEVMHLDVIDGDKLRGSEAQTAFIERTADRIDQLLEDEDYEFEDPDTGKGRDLEPGDIYVLTRTNREADEVGDALAAREIPHAFYRKPGLFETDEALEVLRLLRAIARPGDRSRRRKAMLTPFFGIRLDELTAYEASEGEFTPRKRLEGWQTTARRREFTKLFDAIMGQSGVVRRELVSRSSERRLTNYRQIFEWLLQQAAGSQMGVEELADRLYRFREGHESDSEEEGTDLQRLETDRSSVQIMTIHKCKGLSAEVVFVCGGFSKRDDFNGKRKLKVFKADGADAPMAVHDDTFDEFAFEDAKLKEKYRETVLEEIERLFYVAVTRAKAKVYLPFYDEKYDYYGWPSKRQLKILFDALRPHLGDGFRAPAEGFEVDRFTVDDVDLDPAVPALVNDAEPLGAVSDDELADIAGRHPPEAIDGTRFEAMREGRMRVNTSFSGMSDETSDRGEAVPEEHETPLPPGIEAGNAVHAILEVLDYTTARGVGTWQAWLKRSGARRGNAGEEQTVGELIEEYLGEFGFDSEYVDYTAERLFAALRAPLRLLLRSSGGEGGGGVTLPALSELPDERTAREVGFTLPLPQTRERAMEGPRAGARIENGYFNGEIDLLFDDADGRIYFADWKGSTRVGPGRDYSRETLAAFVEEEYREQAAVYTTALVRMLGITDRKAYEEQVGGFFYLFVRGMRRGDAEQGQYFERVAWERVEALQKKLAEQSPKDAIDAWL